MRYTNKIKHCDLNWFNIQNRLYKAYSKSLHCENPGHDLGAGGWVEKSADTGVREEKFSALPGIILTHK